MSPERMSPMGAVNAVLLPALAAVAVATILAFAALMFDDSFHRREALEFSLMGALICLPAALLYSLGAMLVLRKRPRPRRSRLALAGVLAGLSYLAMGGMLVEAPFIVFAPASAAWAFLTNALETGALRQTIVPLSMMAGALGGGLVGGIVLHGVGWKG